jgi:hypothetical protein
MGSEAKGERRGSEARSPREQIDLVKRGGVMARGLDERGERESARHGEVIHSRRGHRAPEESERQSGEQIHHYHK